MPQRMIRFAAVVVAVVIVGFASSVALARQPADPPATAPNAAPGAMPVAPADPSSPRGVLKTLLSAIQRGDGAAIRECIHVETAIETKMVDALARRALAEKNFRDAAIKAFGADSAKDLVGDSEAANTANMSQLDAAAEKIDGDTANVDSNTGADPVKLKKYDGHWQVPASEFAKATAEMEVEQRIEDMNFAADLITQYANDVSSGKYKSADEAGNAIKTQMMDAMIKHDAERRAATQSTTQPTTQP